MSAGRGSELQWSRKAMEEAYQCKTSVISRGAKDDKAVKALNIIITWHEYGVTYEADPRHAEIIVSELGLSDASKDTPDTNDSDEMMSELHSTRYRSLVARANYLAHDRADIQFACKELSSRMSQPTKADWESLKRFGRYLKGAPRVIHDMLFQAAIDHDVVYSDANWAGDQESRKSTSGGVIRFGEHTLKSCSKTQSVIALSSAESKLYALIKATAEGLGIQSILRDIDVKCSVATKGDASSALAIIGCRGLGKVRHIDTGHLWVRDLAARKRATYNKMGSSVNSADLMTKALPAHVAHEHMEGIGELPSAGRSQLAASVGLELLETNPGIGCISLYAGDILGPVGSIQPAADITGVIGASTTSNGHRG